MFANREMVVPAIQDDVLLGMDMGQRTDVITSKGVVKIDDREIPCTHIKSSRVYKVTSADTYYIQGNTEQEIEVYIESCPCETGTPTEFLIEPSNNFTERYSMMMARSLVDVSTSVTGNMRLMNPFDQEAVIWQNSVLGQAELLDQETEVISCVSVGNTEGSLGMPTEPGEGLCKPAKGVVHNLSGTETRTATQTIDITQGDRFRQVESQGTSGIQHINSASSGIPEHLQELYERATEGNTPADKQVIFNILRHFSDIFSKDATD